MILGLFSGLWSGLSSERLTRMALGAVSAAGLAVAAAPATAQVASSCYAFVENAPRHEIAPSETAAGWTDQGAPTRGWPWGSPLLKRAAFFDGLEKGEVGVTFVNHATFLFETSDGVSLATDFAGYAGPNVTPTAVTMNGAHSTHFTNFPDPKIKHVLRGWSETPGVAAKHDLDLGELRVRNVATDVIRYGGVREPKANSIFVFEVAELCIGHLGHLHHVPTAAQLAEIGFLDVVLAPVDGGYTLSHEELMTTLQQLRARLVIPMHYFGGSSLNRFVERFAESEYEIAASESASVVLSRSMLPKKQTLLVLPPVSPGSLFDD